MRRTSSLADRGVGDLLQAEAHGDGVTRGDDRRRRGRSARRRSPRLPAPGGAAAAWSAWRSVRSRVGTFTRGSGRPVTGSCVGSTAACRRHGRVERERRHAREQTARSSATTEVRREVGPPHSLAPRAGAEPPLAPVVRHVQLAEERRVRTVVVAGLVRRVVEAVHGVLPPAVVRVRVQAAAAEALLRRPALRPRRPRDVGLLHPPVAARQAAPCRRRSCSCAACARCGRPSWSGASSR